jgi:cell division protein ZapA
MAKRNVPAGGFFWAGAEYNHDTTLVEPKMRVTIMSANTHNRVTVHILGEEYVVKGKASSDHIRKLGTYVDEIMSEIQQRSPCLSTMQVAILAAVNIAAELHRVREDYDELLQLLQDSDSNTESS